MYSTALHSFFDKNKDWIARAARFINGEISYKELLESRFYCVKSNDIEKQRIEAELLICECCGIKFNAHRLACHIIKNNICEDDTIESEKTIEVHCPHCNFKYDLVVSECDAINN